jgi:hypothetical protein
MNVRDMNVRAEAMSQIFRRLNGLNGYGREIDRHENISNVHLFHGDKIDQERAINLSLLVKGNSFLARNRKTCSQLRRIIALPPPSEKRHERMAKGAMPEHR